MRVSAILIFVSRFLYPFMLLFGFYIIIYGDVSPGGGFQGGTILATAYLAAYYANPEQVRDLKRIVNFEKAIFILILLTASVSLVTKGVFFTNFAAVEGAVEGKKFFLVMINLLIGLKVAAGLIAIFSTFIREGE